MLECLVEALLWFDLDDVLNRVDLDEDWWDFGEAEEAEWEWTDFFADGEVDFDFDDKEEDFDFDDKVELEWQDLEFEDLEEDLDFKDRSCVTADASSCKAVLSTVITDDGYGWCWCCWWGGKEGASELSLNLSDSWKSVISFGLTRKLRPS